MLKKSTEERHLFARQGGEAAKYKRQAEIALFPFCLAFCVIPLSSSNLGNSVTFLYQRPLSTFPSFKSSWSTMVRTLFIISYYLGWN